MALIQSRFIAFLALVAFIVLIALVHAGFIAFIALIAFISLIAFIKGRLIAFIAFIPFIAFVAFIVIVGIFGWLSAAQGARFERRQAAQRCIVQKLQDVRDNEGHEENPSRLAARLMTGRIWLKACGDIGHPRVNLKLSRSVLATQIVTGYDCMPETKTAEETGEVRQAPIQTAQPPLS
jgi:hypothetical protein